MDIIQIVFLGIIASILYLILKDMNESFAFFIVIFTGIIILILIIQNLHAIFLMIESLGEKADVDDLYIKTILKIIGIAYITELGANVTKDAGLESIASKIELSGKIFILLLAIPIITAVIEMILSFLPSI